MLCLNNAPKHYWISPNPTKILCESTMVSDSLWSFKTIAYTCEEMKINEMFYLFQHGRHNLLQQYYELFVGQVSKRAAWGRVTILVQTISVSKGRPGEPREDNCVDTTWDQALAIRLSYMWYQLILLVLPYTSSEWLLGCKQVTSIQLPKRHLTMADIVTTKHMFGPDVGSIKVKTIRCRPCPATLIMEPLSPTMSTYLNMTLTWNVMFVNKFQLLLTASRKIRLATVEAFPNRIAPTLNEALKSVVSIYQWAGYWIDFALMDYEFKVFAGI
jgi:hypothetical protein